MVSSCVCVKIVLIHIAEAESFLLSSVAVWCGRKVLDSAVFLWLECVYGDFFFFLCGEEMLPFLSGLYSFAGRQEVLPHISCSH